MKHLKQLLASILVFASLLSCKNEHTDLGDGIFAQITTNKGDIIVQLEYEKVPVTVANFVSLAEGKNPFVEEQYKRKPFYDGLKFHRVISVANGDSEDFMIQGGDPMGDGSGGPGYQFKDEFHADLKHDKGGILSMANAGPGTNGSQFFITIKETPWLDGKHTVFGHVVEGQEIINTILQNDVIEKITILRNGAEAKKFDAVKIFKDYYAKEAEANKIMAEKSKAAKAENVARIEALRTNGTRTPSGIIYEFLNKGEGKKPANGTKVFINYAGFLQSTGELFDTSFASVAEKFGKFDANRAAQNGYQPFPFTYGDKQGLIPGFIEGIEQMSFGDKILVYIPSKLGYGTQGAGNVIPPNSDIVFEIELLENLPNP